MISDKPSVKMKTRLTIWLCLPVLVLLIYMIWGIWKVSIKEGEKWKKLANSQQLKSTVVTASRGTIYDAKGNVLAQSATVYRIFVDPVMLKQQCDKRDARITELTAAIKEEDDDVTLARYKAELAEAKTGEETFNELVEFLAVKLQLDTSDVRSKLGDTSQQYIVLKESVEKTLRDEIDAKLTELKIDGVRGEPNTRRVYPQETLAAHVLGHTDYSGAGTYGLEAYYDDYLRGVDGRVITATDKDGNDIPYRYKQSYDVQDGNDLMLMDVVGVDDTMLSDLQDREDSVLVRRLVRECLTDREREIVTLRYGLGGRMPRTQREIAKKLGISRSYVSRIEKRALEKLEEAIGERG